MSAGSYRVTTGYFYCVRNVADDTLVETGEFEVENGERRYFPDTELDRGNPAAAVPVTQRHAGAGPEL